MPKFKIEIPNVRVGEYPKESWDRLIKILSDGTFKGYIYGHQNLERGSWTYYGEAETNAITILQAAARGDDLEAVIRMVEAKRGINGASEGGSRTSK